MDLSLDRCGLFYLMGFESQRLVRLSVAYCSDTSNPHLLWLINLSSAACLVFGFLTDIFRRPQQPTTAFSSDEILTAAVAALAHTHTHTHTHLHRLPCHHHIYTAFHNLNHTKTIHTSIHPSSHRLRKHRGGDDDNHNIRTLLNCYYQPTLLS